MSETLVFVDIETTGLNVADRVIEIGILPVGGNMRPLDEGWSRVINCEDAILDHLNPVVLEMHSNNGLLAEIASGQCLGIGEISRQACIYLNQWGQPGEIPMAGSSVHFDRKFLERQVPSIEAWFHYRNFDVSTIKELFKRRWPKLGEPPKENAHRALADCYASLRELQWYLDRLEASDPWEGTE